MIKIFLAFFAIVALIAIVYFIFYIIYQTVSTFLYDKVYNFIDNLIDKIFKY